MLRVSSNGVLGLRLCKVSPSSEQLSVVEATSCVERGKIALRHW